MRVESISTSTRLGAEVERDLLWQAFTGTISVVRCPKPTLAQRFSETSLWKILIPIGLFGMVLVFLGDIEWLWLLEIQQKLGWSFLHQIPKLVEAIGQAIVVAAVLGSLVDYFLKERLLREISTNVFEHMLGFDQQPEIKQRLRQIVSETKMYRRNCEICWTMLDEQDGLLPVKLSIRFDLVNPTLDGLLYKPSFSCKTADHPSACKFTVVSNDAEPKVFTAKFDEGSGEATARANEDVFIKPASRDDVVYRFVTEVDMQLPPNYYHPLFFIHPTIGVTVFIKAAESLNVFVSAMEGGNNGVWHSSGLFMHGHPGLEIRWQRRLVVSSAPERGVQ